MTHLLLHFMEILDGLVALMQTVDLVLPTEQLLN